MTVRLLTETGAPFASAGAWLSRHGGALPFLALSASAVTTWLAWRGVREGAVGTQYGVIRRNKSPVRFWFLVGTLLVVGCAFLTVFVLTLVYEQPREYPQGNGIER